MGLVRSLTEMGLGLCFGTDFFQVAVAASPNARQLLFDTAKE
jgi:hypothetical protein